MRKSDGMADLKDILSRWKPWIPPKQDQAFQQVGDCALGRARLLSGVVGGRGREGGGG
jgi:hypothetical protein